MNLLDHYYHADCYWAHMITFNCDGGCPYCINRSRGRVASYSEMKGRDVVEFWNSIPRHDGRPLSIIGGEPTLHVDFVEILWGLRGYNVTVTSNLATKFFEAHDFCDVLKGAQRLRMNTTFHPTAKISPKVFAECIFRMKEAGINVGQIGVVNHPRYDRKRWKAEFDKVGLCVSEVTFLGFWTDKHGFSEDDDMHPANLWPNEKISKHLLNAECGIDSLEHYRAQCGQPQDSVIEWNCNSGMRTLLVAPDGTVHECHYKLYRGVDMLGNVMAGWRQIEMPRTCFHFGKCIGCDIPRTMDMDWRKAKVIEAGRRL